MKCPFCGSEDLVSLPCTDFMRIKYSKEYEEGEYIYSFVKRLCLGCGYVFQKMSDEDLEKYHNEKQYFK